MDYLGPIRDPVSLLIETREGILTGIELRSPYALPLQRVLLYIEGLAGMSLLLLITQPHVPDIYKEA